MKIKNIICAALTSLAVMTASVTAYAESIKIDPIISQPDEICGYVNIHSTTDADVYVKIFKHTPETVSEGYQVYDTVIDADLVHVSNVYVLPLEYNNFNADTEDYEGTYDVMLGVHRHADSSEEDDIAYVQFPVLIEDRNISGYDTYYSINVFISEEELQEPVLEESGKAPNTTYNITFSCLTETVIPGDANGDKVVNIRDAAFIASMLAASKGDQIPPNADYNGDGVVNIRDAAAIATFLANGGKQNPEPPAEPAVTTAPVVTGAAETTVTTVSTVSTAVSSITTAENTIPSEQSSTTQTEAVTTSASEAAAVTSAA
ncbi:MAG: dockerin type I repeat-containing protein [Porcipelethomonas sp.]